MNISAGGADSISLISGIVRASARINIDPPFCHHICACCILCNQAISFIGLYIICGCYSC
ncbi:MAG: hypothetical protein ACLRSW_13330 [Christensenellaceae bacterium]